MIGIDTNVLVRFLTRDDPAQSMEAEKIMKKHCSCGNPGWIGVIVLCELVWVLQRGYHYKKKEICAVLGQLLRTAELEIEEKDSVRSALEVFELQSADFSDCLIIQRNRRAGVTHTYTFDKNASKVTGFKLIRVLEK